LAITLSFMGCWGALGAFNAAREAGVFVIDVGFWLYCRKKIARYGRAVRPL